MAGNILWRAGHNPAYSRSLDQSPVIADVSLPGLRILCDPVACSDVGTVVKTRGRNRNGKLRKAAVAEKLFSLMDLFHNRSAADYLRLQQMIHGVDPAVRDFFGAALQTQAIDFSRCRQSTDQNRAGIFSIFGISDVFKEKSLAFEFFQAAKLPAHQRLKLSILIDLASNTNKLPVLLQDRNELAQVAIVFGELPL